MPPKPRKPKKYTSKIRVLENRAVRGECTCGWVGNALAQTSGIARALSDVQSEIQAHTHIKKEK